MGKIAFILSGNIPSKKNSKQIFKNKKTGKHFISCSKTYKLWNKEARLQILQQIMNDDTIRHILPISSCKKITVYLFFGNKRKTDNTNKVESIHDLLVDYGILIDDNWMITGETHQIPVYREREPGARVEIEF